MRPLSLTLSAFGPFQDVQTIPFDQLGDSPLFLINGPTGSGKTTILDAICFALYGRTTGNEREGSQMRCDHAAPDTLTEVIFSFELAGRRYRIRRVPEQQRPKARGEGTTTQSTEAQLWVIGPNGEERLLVPNKVTEANREIEQLTGLNVDQFRQVMVLPQGKFRELLLAESKQREEIFSQLFQTRIYRQLEERLKSQSAEIRHRVEQVRESRQAILHSVDLEQPEQIEQARQELQPELERAARKRKEAEQQHSEALAALERGRHLQEDFNRLADLQQQATTLHQRQGEIDAWRQQLDLAQQAERLKPLFDQYSAADRLRQDSVRRQQQALDALAQAKQGLLAAEAALEKQQASAATLDKLKAQLTRLQSYRQRATRLDEATDKQQRAELDAGKTSDALSHKQTKLDQSIRQQEQLDKKRQAQQAQLDQLQDAPLQQQQVKEQLRDRRVLEQTRLDLLNLNQQLQQDEQTGKQLAAEHTTAQAKARHMELDWHRGQAALLARELKLDQPCPVCGSLEHPAPARSDSDLPDQEALEQSRQAVQMLQDQLTRQRESYASKKSELKTLVVRIGELEQQLGTVKDEPLVQLTERAKQLSGSVQRLETVRQQLQQIEASERTLKQNTAQLRTELAALNEQLMKQQAEVAAARSELQAAEQELPAVYREPGALAQAIKDCEIQIAGLEQAIEQARADHQRASSERAAAEAACQSTTQTRASAEADAQQASERWRGALNTAPFESPEAFTQALMTDQQQLELRQQVDGYEQASQRIAGALQQQQTALEGKSPPDIPALEQQLSSAVVLRNSADQAWRELDKRQDQLQRAAAQLAENQRQHQALEQEYAVVGTLSDVANGQVGDKISLQRFVLSVLLDDVLLEASRRLHLMSKGRYQLLRKNERAKGNRASGLDLEVEDAYTGKCRPVATLSGGESFLAALSLALGLSDVVQAYSGGIRLDTLFIDEGFGSLDPESLDLAIRALIDLQASGRMIGIISHVAELKEQMSLRLDIQTSRQGSQVRLVTQ